MWLQLLGLLLVSWSSSVTALTDDRFKIAREGWHNPSVAVQLSTNRTFTSFRQTWIKNIDGKQWWFNKAFLCQGGKDIQHLKCKQYNPFKSRVPECTYGNRTNRAETANIEDVKMWHWPGKGVYAMFGRKPPPPPGTDICKGPIVFHQWLAQVAADPYLPVEDPWNLIGKTPVPLLPGDKLAPGYSDEAPASFIFEKNWMPFVYWDPKTHEERVYFTYMVVPHMVYQLFPNGTAVHRWTTADLGIMNRFEGLDVHGGPPILHMPGSVTGEPEDYYLGIVHTVECYGRQKIRVYRHYAYKTSAHPPFAVTAVSDELPLVFKTTGNSGWIAFAAGLTLTPNKEVLLSYGSADSDSRALTLTIPELNSFFTGNTASRPFNGPGPVGNGRGVRCFADHDSEKGKHGKRIKKGGMHLQGNV